MRVVFFFIQSRRVLSSIGQLLRCKSLTMACLLMMQLVFSPFVQAAPGDENWSSQFAFEGLDGVVYATTTDNAGNIYVGGDFSHADGLLVNRVAMWDGNSWSALGAGVGSDEGQDVSQNYSVRALAHDGTNLYVGGIFDSAGGNSNGNNIAKWDGTNWSALDTGLNDTVNALAHDGNNLFVGGRFKDAGGDPNGDRFAAWDGSGWLSLGTPLNGTIYAMAHDGSDLYIGGSFTNAFGNPLASRIAKWNGSTFSALIDGTNVGLNGSVFTLAHDGSDLYVGGRFTDAGGISDADRIAKWNGSSWSALGQGLDGDVAALSSDGSTLYAGGFFDDAGGDLNADHLAQWDGSSWSAVGAGVPSAVRALVHEGNDLYVGGFFQNASDAANSNGIATWDGVNWSGLSNAPFTAGVDWHGLTYPGFALATDNAGNLYVGGFFTDAGGDINADKIAKWDGNSWSALGSGLNGTVGDMLFVGNDLYVVGNFTDAGGDPNADRIAKWDGNSWSALGTGLNDYAFKLAHDGIDLYVAGSFTDAGGNPSADNIAVWDGSSWLAMGAGLNDYASDLVFDGNDLYVAGIFTDAGGDPNADYIAKWTGSSWSAIGGGLGIMDSGEDCDGFISINALALEGNNLYAGGCFINAAGNSNADYIVQWNGSSWSALDSGLTSYVKALLVDGGNLYVGGRFIDAGGDLNADKVAKWDGNSWSALGSGVNDQVEELAFDGDTLIVTGFFTQAGDKPSSQIALWHQPRIISPSDGSTLSGSTQDFFWSASGATVTEWEFELTDTTTGAQLYIATGLGSSNLNTTATGLPVDGRAIAATLSYRLLGDNTWYSTEASYIAAIGSEITSPIANSTLNGESVVFQWTAVPGATTYRVWLGSTSGGDEYGRLSSSGTSATASGLPTDGSTVYATLKWYAGSWNTEATVSYTAFTATAAPVISSPVVGSTLSGSSETFQWTTAPGATTYRVWLGSTTGGDEYGRLSSSGTSASSTSLPTDGSTVYATLKWYDSIWHTEPSVSYIAFTAILQPIITSPVVGSTLSGASETFQWTAASGATTYRVWLGSTSGGDEYGRLSSSGTSAASNALPTDGSTVFATLKWNDGIWHTEPAVSYTAFTAIAQPTITSPVAGSTLSGSNETFQWTTVSGATTYRVWLGSTLGGDEYGRLASNSNSATSNGLPTDGSPVYATLKWNDGIWHTEPSVSYTAFTASTGPIITTPVPGSILSGPNETFQWTTEPGATAYRVWLGSTSGGDDYGRLSSTGNSATSSNLPTDGSVVYATLKWFDGSWHSETPVTYTAASESSAFTSPIAGSTINGGTETFQWDAIAGATTYRIWMGSTSGGDEHGRNSSTSTSRSVTGLPTDGSTVYATLKWFDGSWHTEPSVSYNTAP